MTWSVSNYSLTPDANTSINGINIAELCNASNINDAIRQMMADIAAGPWILGANNLTDLTDITAARANLGLGTASTQEIGTSGQTVPWLNGTNTWANFNTFLVGASFGDVNYFNQIQGGNPYIIFDPNDYLFYNRASDYFSVVVGGVEAMRVTSAGITIGNISTSTSVNVQNANYTFALADANNIVHQSSGSGHRWTVPTNASAAFPLGTRIRLTEYAGASIILSPASGVNIGLAGIGGSTGGTIAAWGVVNLDKVDTNTWIASGNIS